MSSLYRPYADWFASVTFTSSGRPDLLTDEVIVATFPETNLYDQHNKLLESNPCILTSRRIIYCPQTREHAFSINLLYLIEFSLFEEWFKTPKIVIKIRDIAQDKTITTPETVQSVFNVSPNGQSVHPAKAIFMLGIKDKKTVHSFLQQLLSTHSAAVKSWTLQLRTQQQNSRIDYGHQVERAQNIGISGVLRRKEQQQHEQHSKLQQAMGDLDELMHHAQEVTIVLEKLSAKAIARQSKQASTNVTTPTNDTDNNNNNDLGNDGPQSPTAEAAAVEEENLDNILLQMGYTSATTKISSGNSYIQDLSRELYDFMTVLFKHSTQKTLTLIDVYCIYNRTRGTDLISPQDILQGCQLWEKIISIPQPIRLTKLKSGSYVIHRPGYDENAIRHKILHYVFLHNITENLSTLSLDTLDGTFNTANISFSLQQLMRQTSTDVLSNKAGVTALDVSVFFRTSLQLATDYLEALVKDNSILRDSSQTTVFYWFNFFTQLNPQDYVKVKASSTKV